MRCLLFILLLALVGCGSDKSAPMPDAPSAHFREPCQDQGGTCERACVVTPTLEQVACTIRSDQHDPGLMLDRTFVFEGVRGACVLAANELTVFDECDQH